VHGTRNQRFHLIQYRQQCLVRLRKIRLHTECRFIHSARPPPGRQSLHSAPVKITGVPASKWRPPPESFSLQATLFHDCPTSWNSSRISFKTCQVHSRGWREASSSARRVRIVSFSEITYHCSSEQYRLQNTSCSNKLQKRYRRSPPSDYDPLANSTRR